MTNTISYKVETSLQDTQIHQKVFAIQDTIVKELSHKICATEDKQFKEALIALGWTPPKEID